MDNEEKNSQKPNMKMVILSVVVTTLVASSLTYVRRSLAEPSVPNGVPVEKRDQYIEAKKHMDAGRKSIRKHKLEEAVKSFKKAIKVYPRMKEAYISIGDIYQVYKDYEKALQEYSRVLKVDDKYASAYFRRGHSYMGLRKWNKAIGEFSTAIKFKPNFMEAYDGRSQAYRYRGDKENRNIDFELSIDDYEKARQLEKSNK
ncbi:tetratricopeptide repeat protein [Candidatus Uabimicrobium sp. HlEnr_7]|uniref:tetratricopeptide repeat protein n=1 Tax=Candidatus Uabimicrobium helgolandensis TaxID=3095367 RepID=UPI00355680A4